MTGGLAALAGAALIPRGLTGHFDFAKILGLRKPPQPWTSVRGGRSVQVVESVKVLRLPKNLFRVYRNLEGLPKIMRHVHRVKQIGDNRWRWTVVDTYRENKPIGWRSLPGLAVDTAGSVPFLLGLFGRGTVVKAAPR